MEVQEMNKVIAEFMGVKIHDTWGSYIDTTYHGIHHPSPTHEHKLTQEQVEFNENIEKTNVYNPKYHSSWDWLMPVVEKISKIQIINAEHPSETFYPRTFGMLSGDGKVMVRFNCCVVFKAKTLIEATYNAVCDFITWYNQQKH